MNENTHVIHTTHTIETLPTIERTVAVVTEHDTDVNADEVYSAYEVYAEDVAISEADFEATLQRRAESDLHPSCRQGNEPTFAVEEEGIFSTHWSDGSFTVDKEDYFAS